MVELIMAHLVEIVASLVMLTVVPLVASKVNKYLDSQNSRQVAESLGRIADSITDEYLAKNPNSKVAKAIDDITDEILIHANLKVKRKETAKRIATEAITKKASMGDISISKAGIIKGVINAIL